MTRTARRRTAAATNPAVIAAPARRAVAEGLEPRRLFAATVVMPLPNASGDGGATQTVDLQPFFQDPANSVVRLNTTSGVVDVRTLDQAAPLNAANFLAYVNSGRYTNSYFHRPVPGFVLQGGSFYPDDSEVPADPPVASEPNNGRSNVRGTVAFARLGGNPDSATSGFFFNLADNSANLDFQNEGFTVFGQVLGNGMTVVDALTAAAVQNAKAARITGAALVDDVTYTVTSSDPAVVAGTINANNDLVLTYGNANGSATVTVTATDLDGATSVQNAFTATSAFDGTALNVALGGADGARSVAFTDAAGVVTTVSLRGAGTANLRFTGTNLAQATARGRTTVTGEGLGLAAVAVTGSDASTAVTVGSRGGTGLVSLGGITTDGAVRSITGRRVLLTGPLTTAGATGSVTLGGVTATALTLGGAATDRGATLSLGQATDAAVTSAAPIRSLRVAAATNTSPAAEVITAPAIQSVTSDGDFAADLVAADNGNIGSVRVNGNLTGDVTARQIGSVSVRGDMTGSTVTATRGAGEFTDQRAANAKSARALGTLAVRGAVTNSVVNSGGSIGTVSAASMTGSRVVAGAPTLTGLPTSAAQLTEPSTLNTLSVKGAFADTIVAARFINRASVAAFTPGGGTTETYGFAADQITSLSGRTDAGQTFAVRRADDQADVDAALPSDPLGSAVVRVV